MRQRCSLRFLALVRMEDLDIQETCHSDDFIRSTKTSSSFWASTGLTKARDADVFPFAVGLRRLSIRKFCFAKICLSKGIEFPLRHRSYEITRFIVTAR